MDSRLMLFGHWDPMPLRHGAGHGPFRWLVLPTIVSVVVWKFHVPYRGLVRWRTLVRHRYILHHRNRIGRLGCICRQIPFFVDERRRVAPACSPACTHHPWYPYYIHYLLHQQGNYHTPEPCYPHLDDDYPFGVVVLHDLSSSSFLVLLRNPYHLPRRNLHCTPSRNHNRACPVEGVAGAYRLERERGRQHQGRHCQRMIRSHS
mmetsp:Transcript_8131/g.14719  ORF Transcript_8131/g.14719 Transcript_8131/m.14719 type:complete len:204 (-) Transcript_8131:819-1430(-)